MTKWEFLDSYSYLDEEDYDLTAEKVNSMTTEEVEIIKDKIKQLPVEE